MLSTTHNTQHNQPDKLPDDSDLLLTERYKLQKEIKALNKTLQDSMNILRDLECDLKIKLTLKTQLDACIHSFEEIQKESGLPASKNTLLNELIEKFNAATILQELTETVQKEKYEYSRVKQTLIDRQLLLSNEIKILLEKTENRNNANSDVFEELKTLKGQLENIIACISRAKA